jgi:thiol-disulfide isomerase/thioredoxin
MVNLWATWCAPCIAEMPTLDKLAVREKDRFRLIVVSQDLAGKREVDPFFAKAKFAALEPYLDKQNVLMTAIGTETLPTTIFYDAKGKEQWRVMGAMDWQGERAKTLIYGALEPKG